MQVRRTQPNRIPSAVCALAVLSFMWGLMPRAAHAQTVWAPCPGHAAIIFLINGINTSVTEAQVAQDAFRAKLYQSLGCAVPVRTAYNTTQGFKEDLYESAKQKGLVPADESLFWLVVNGATDIAAGDEAALVGTLTNFFVDELVTNILALQGTTLDQTQLDVSDHIGQYNIALDGGRRVILVGHSQGNLFANSEYDLITGADSTRVRSMRVLGVATPDYRVAGDVTGTRYATVLDDVITLVPGALPANVLGSPGCDIGFPSVTCHLLETYLSSAPAWANILENVRRSMRDGNPTVGFTVVSGKDEVVADGQVATIRAPSDVGISVLLTGLVRTDPNGRLISWSWSVDGVANTTVAPSLSTALSLGTHTITLSATDWLGGRSPLVSTTVTVVQENQSEIAFSNFGPNDAVGSGGIGIAPGFTRGFDWFVRPGPDLALDSIELALGSFAGPPFGGTVNHTKIQLMTDAGGRPGTVVEVYQVDDALGSSSAGNLVKCISTGHPVLAGGARYWLVIGPNPSSSVMVIWNPNVIGQSGTAFTLESGLSVAMPRGAFRVMASAGSPQQRR